MYTTTRVAGAAAIIKDEKILLLKRSMNSTNHPGRWTFPAGGVEPNDASMEACVIREVKEETNLDFTPTDKFRFYDGMINGIRYISLVYLGNFTGNLKIDIESDDAGFFSYEETLTLEVAFSYPETLKDLREAGII